VHPGATEPLLQRAWTRRGALAWLLLPLALLFGALAAVRRALYRAGILHSSRVSRPVVVVGNLVAGGAGKTPLTLALIAALRAAGRHPGVISRGHGGSASAAGAVLPDDATAQPGAATRYGDEPCLIQRKSGVPVAIGRDRVAAAQRLIAAHPEVDVLLADDGLQHYALARNFEIAVFDARGAGNGWLLPAGPLREPLARLASVDAVVINGAAPADFLHTLPRRLPCHGMTLETGDAWQLIAPAQRRTLAGFRGQRIQALAGIGQPQRFFDTLTAAGIACTGHALPDHYAWGADAARLFDPAAEFILITEKDAVKCLGRSDLADPRVWVVEVAATPEAGLVESILEKLRGFTAA